MRHMLPTAGLMLTLMLVVSPAFASCDDELATLDKRVAADATTSVASASSGQGVAAKRTGAAGAAHHADVPVSEVAKGPAPGSTEAHAAQASGTGDKVIQAKATINAARVAKGKGDEAACLAGVAKAKAQLD